MFCRCVSDGLPKSCTSALEEDFFYEFYEAIMLQLLITEGTLMISDVNGENDLKLRLLAWWMEDDAATGARATLSERRHQRGGS